MMMRPLGLIGMLLVIAGIVALAVPSFTYFATERVADVGFFTIDVSRPHTIFFNPVAGGVLLAIGVFLVMVGWRTRTA